MQKDLVGAIWLSQLPVEAWHSQSYHMILLLYIILFTALQTLIPIPDTCATRSYTALSGNRVVLPCPIEPGALLQHYSAIWMKGSVMIAEAINPQNVRKTDCRYDIDRATYALIINPVSVNDSSTDYKCQVLVNNPTTRTRQQLHYYPQSLSLTVNANSKFAYNFNISHALMIRLITIILLCSCCFINRDQSVAILNSTDSTMSFMCICQCPQNHNN